MYDAWLSLHAEGSAYVRMQTNFLHNQVFDPEYGTIDQMDKQLPELRERLKNQWQYFGDDMMRTGGIGEWAAVLALPTANMNNYLVWRESQRLVAQAQWHNENAQPGSATNQDTIELVVRTYEEMDAQYGIKHLRWGLQHADFATPDQLARLKALGVAVSASGFRWLGGTPRADGLPFGAQFRQIKDSGIPMGLHEDGIHIAPHNPWFALHYATTGLNVSGVQINPGQQLTRQEALHAYTRGNAWFNRQEKNLGSIEKGKFADVVILDKDYFTVSDAEIRTIRPIMSIVGGGIVHDTGVLRGKRDWSNGTNHPYDSSWWQTA
jgi:predicted amidohydrolase YtcJ